MQEIRSKTPSLPLATLVLLGALAGPVGAQSSAPKRMDAVGLLDYHRPPDFKVGDWVKYHMTGRSEQGMSDDYYLTVFIAGEEEFWGERCVWVETHIQAPGTSSRGVASLVSYDAFQPDLPMYKAQMYMRKNISGLDQQGNPDVQVLRVPRGKLQTPRNTPAPYIARDTLGTDSVRTSKGTYLAQVEQWREGYGTNEDRGDSTIRETYMEKRRVYYSLEIPITHLAKEVLEVEGTRKAWLIGQSAESAPETIRDRAIGESVVVDFGTGRVSRVIPERFRKSIEEQKREAAAAGSAAPKARPDAKPGVKTDTKKSGR